MVFMNALYLQPISSFYYKSKAQTLYTDSFLKLGASSYCPTLTTTAAVSNYGNIQMETFNIACNRSQSGILGTCFTKFTGSTTYFSILEQY